MTAYNDIATSQDRGFLARCKLKLGNEEFNRLAQIASEAFQAAYKAEPAEHRKNNAARRAANIIFTRAMK